MIYQDDNGSDVLDKQWIDIDGSKGEGGGQVLRSALALSILTGKRFRLKHIRARRSKPGLQPQHLRCVLAAKEICGANVIGDALQSQILTFIPGKVQPGPYRFDIGTAGATTLVLHTVYLPLMLGTADASSITITGGTHNDHAPCFDFLETTWAGYLRMLGLPVELTLTRYGFYPKGGGEVVATLSPASKVNSWTQPDGVEASEFVIRGKSIVCNLPEEIAQRQKEQVEKRLAAAGISCEISIGAVKGNSPGTVVALHLPTTVVPTVYFGLGARGKRAETVADEAVNQLLQHLNTDASAIDPHSADQLLLPLAFAEGTSKFRVMEVTQHLLTNVGIIKQFVERPLEVMGEEREAGVVVVGS